MPVHEIFEEILAISDQFVPSEAGSVLIDDPQIKVQHPWDAGENELVFVACYGDKSEQLIGRRMRASDGIVGKCYMTGEPVLSRDTSTDRDHFGDFDAETEHQTLSVVCVPIRIGTSTIGVLELLNRKGGGHYVPQELELLQIFAGYISTSLQNILDANRYRELAKRDDLTGLYNDRYFNQKLSEEVDRAEHDGGELSLIFLDLDHFKAVNDTHGHLVGSQTLREVGLILARTVTEERATVARYGGDEFVIIVPGYGVEACRELAEEIRARVENSMFRIDPGQETGVMLRAGTISASIGVASYQDMRFDPDDKLRRRKNEFIRLADQSMYEAKAQGKNRVCLGTYDALSSTKTRIKSTGS